MSILKSPRSAAAELASSSATNVPTDLWLAFVQVKVQSLRYGSLQIVVHDGKVVQIETTQKTRVPSASIAGTSANDGANAPLR